MISMLYAVAGLLVTAGALAVLYGADNIRADSGAAWLQSGATLAASGFLLLAMTAVLAELRRVRRGLSEMAVEVQEFPALSETAPPPPPPRPEVILPMAGPAGAVEAATAPERPETETLPDAGEALPEPPVAAPEAAPGVVEGPATVVGTYASGQSTYVMYSDGTIEAEMTDGRYRFESMAALRHFVDTGEGGHRIESDAPGQADALPHAPAAVGEQRPA